MPTPVKPFTVLINEKKSHRTKKELKMRQDGEKKLSSGKKITERPEVENNLIAHKQFKRITSLLENIEKADDLYGSVINRYCLLDAECEDDKRLKERLVQRLDELYDQDLEYIDRVTLEMKINENINKCDARIMQKRKMMFDIEKENIMTIASALRSIPKKEEKKNSALLEALGNG